MVRFLNLSLCNRIGLKLFVAAWVIAFTAAPALRAQSGNAESGETSQRIYVCNEGAATLDVINVETNKIVDHIDLQKLGFSANAKPHHAMAEPDGSHWYVTLIGENRVLKFNRKNEIVGQAKMEVPGLISLHPTRDLLLVGRSMSAVNPPKSIAVIDRSEMKVKRKIQTFFGRPHAIATTPSGKWTFVGSLAENQILSINNKTWETHLLQSGGKTDVYVDFAVSPDGNTLLATGQMTGNTLIYNIRNPANPVPTDTIAVNAQPWHPIFSKNGRYVYFGNKGANTVTVLDMKTRTVDAVIEGKGLAEPHGAALSLNGKYLYISNSNTKGSYNPDNKPKEAGIPGTITVINTNSREIVKVLEVGLNTAGIGTQTRW